MKYCIFYYRIAVSSQQVDEYVDFPKFTFCPDRKKANNTFQKQVSIEDVIQQNENFPLENFINTIGPVLYQGKWTKSYKMIKSEDHDFFQPCLTYSKIEQVISDGVATEVNLISQN